MNKCKVKNCTNFSAWQVSLFVNGEKHSETNLCELHMDFNQKNDVELDNGIILEAKGKGWKRAL